MCIRDRLRNVPEEHRDDLAWRLSYISNMSCIGYAHPNVRCDLQQIRDRYGVNVKMHKQRVRVWSYEKLARELNFCGCEVLIIDAEGYDVRILKSMIAHCSNREDSQFDAWPYVIQFETRGHCDNIDGPGEEWGIVASLEKVGYTLVYYSWHDTYLARTLQLRHNEHVRNWAEVLVCSQCGLKGNYPYLHRECGALFCERCCGYPRWSSQWSSHRRACTRHDGAGVSTSAAKSEIRSWSLQGFGAGASRK